MVDKSKERTFYSIIKSPGTVDRSTAPGLYIFHAWTGRPRARAYICPVQGFVLSRCPYTTTGENAPTGTHSGAQGQGGKTGTATPGRPATGGGYQFGAVCPVRLWGGYRGGLPGKANRQKALSATFCRFLIIRFLPFLRLFRPLPGTFCVGLRAVFLLRED